MKRSYNVGAQDSVQRTGLPPEIQYVIVERAGVGVTSNEKDAALAFVKFLKTPFAKKAFRSQGLEPTE